MEGNFLDINNEKFFRSLLEVLPLHAEEDSIREDPTELAIIDHISKKTDPSFSVETAVSIIRCILNSLSLLDQFELEHNRWVFISFPASLLARSILETMANSNKNYIPSSYWSQDSGTPLKDVEKQRELLQLLENQRIPNPKKDFSTIRTVHVVWGFIRYGSKFAMVKREDKRRPGVAGYGFPGGRLNFKDLPKDKRKTTYLRDLYQIDSGLAASSRINTLERELDEELDLKPKDYKSKFIQTLQPYRKIEGAKNNHAYTQYNIAIYSIEILPENEPKLLDHTTIDIKWFTVEELEQSKQSDGSKVFINAFLEDGSFRVKDFLNQIPDSRNPPHYTDEDNAIELPASINGSIFKGKSGNKQKKLDIDLTKDEWEFLMFMGWHLKNLDIDLLDESQIILCVGGWIKLLDNSIKSLAISLAKKFSKKSFPLIEYDDRGFCRLSIKSEYLYFQPNCFEYYWNYESDDKPIVLILKNFETKLAILKGKNIVIRIPNKVIKAMPLIEEGKLVEDAGNVNREFRRVMKPAKQLGLHLFVSFRQGAFEILPLMPENSE